MKTSTDRAALSAQLARALGWKIVDTHDVFDYEMQYVGTIYKVAQVRGKNERTFDYRSPDVYGPLIEWLMLEGVNVWNPDGIPTAWEWSEPGGDWGTARSFPEAVARACIAVKKGSK